MFVPRYRGPVAQWQWRLLACVPVSRVAASYTGTFIQTKIYEELNDIVQQLIGNCVVVGSARAVVLPKSRGQGHVDSCQLAVVSGW